MNGNPHFRPLIAIGYVSPLFTSKIAKGSNNFLRVPHHIARSDQGKEWTFRWQSASWISHREDNKNSLSDEELQAMNIATMILQVAVNSVSFEMLVNL